MVSKKNKYFVLIIIFLFVLNLAIPSISFAKQSSDVKDEKVRKSQWKEMKQSREFSGNTEKLKPIKKSVSTNKEATFSKKDNKLKKIASGSEKKAYVEGEVIIKFKSDKDTENSVKKYKFEKKKQLRSVGAELVKIPKGKSVEKVVSELKNDTSVAYVQPNYKIFATGMPNDTYFNNLWGLHNTGQTIQGSQGLNDLDIDLPEAREITEGNSNLVVAVIDTGVDFNHPDLKNNIWTNPNEIPDNHIDDDHNGYVDDVHGWDFYNHDNTVYDSPYDDHGTHVSGTIAASANNNVGVTGIAPKVKIMPLKFLDGPEGTGDTAGAIEAIEYATKMKVKISNNSWGSYAGQAGDLLETAIKNSNMLFVAAAGNEAVNTDETTNYPSGYDLGNILSVAAVDNSGNLANFSNYGMQTVDIAAPGVDILSTVPKQNEKEYGATAQIKTDSYKAIFNGFGFENISDSNSRQNAFNLALQYLQEPMIKNFEDNNPNIQYSGSWSHSNQTGNSGNNFSFSSETGAYTEFTFIGTGIKVLGKTHPSRGLADVYIDGKFVKTIDEYAKQETYKAPIFEKNGLTPGKHTVKIVVKGQKSSQSSGTTITIDSFIVPSQTEIIEDNASNIQFNGTWNHTTQSGNSGNNFSSTTETGAYTELTFSGSAIKVMGKTHPARGLADVYIDGKFVKTIDEYSKQEAYQATVFEKKGLSSGEHTIKIVVKGQKSSQSSGTTVTIDAFMVTPHSSVLLVQDDEASIGNNSYLDSYSELLNNSEVSFGEISVNAEDNGPNLSTLQDYDIVLWFTGDANGYTGTTLTSDDQNNVMAYLNSGGNLLLTGQDALWQAEESPFVKDMLHLKVLGEGYSRNVSGVTNTIYSGKSYQISQIPYADFIESTNTSISRVNLVYPADSYEDAYAYYSGTSMATPHVTGVAALLYSANSTITPKAAISTLLASGDTLSSLDHKIKSGKMVNAYKALNADSDIPGKPIENESVSDTLDAANDTDDVYSIEAKKGETIRVNLSGSANTDFDLYLYSPDAKTVADSTGMLAHSENVNTSTESIEYVAQKDGTYYIDVYAYKGTGSYKLSSYVSNPVINGFGTYQEDHKAIHFTGDWKPVTDSGYDGGKAIQLPAAGEASLTFTGTEIEWIGAKGPTQGIASVYIDGELVASPSMYAGTVAKQQSIFKKQVPFGTHTIVVQWTGKGDPNSRKSGTEINIDKLVVRENAAVIENNDKKVTYSGNWNHSTQAGNSGNNFSYSSQAGAYAQLTFKGTGIQVLGKTHTARGLADVYIDGKLVKTIDQYTPQQQFKAVIFEADNLPEGTHTIKIVVKGQKSTMASDTTVTVDAFIVPPQTSTIENNSSSVQFNGSWTHTSQLGNSGDHFSYSTQTGAYAQATFTGTTIKVLGKTHSSRGLADVYIDGEFVKTIDEYAPKETYKAVVFEKAGLTNGTHTIKIIVKGQKSSLATGTTVTLDAFIASDGVLFQ